MSHGYDSAITLRSARPSKAAAITGGTKAASGSSCILLIRGRPPVWSSRASSAAVEMSQLQSSSRMVEWRRAEMSGLSIACSVSKCGSYQRTPAAARRHSKR